MDDGFFLAALARASGVGSRYIKCMLDFFGSGEAAWGASRDELLSSGCVPVGVAEAVDAFRRENPDFPAELAQSCSENMIGICSMRDEGYPEPLMRIYDPPAVLFYRGKLSRDAERVAMVGSRKMSAYGEGVARMLAEGLAEAGLTVVSGAARGIDTASHIGALKSGRTVAVLGCGVDVAYPPENRKLLDSIAESGAVISEYGPGTSPLPAFFPARNRIISGLSRGIVVVEAAERSGSLITANLALNEGRDVFAVPGSMYSKTSKGCHRLIQQGAKLVTDLDDILEEYGLGGKKKRKKKASAPARKEMDMTTEEAAVYHVLSDAHALSIDEVIYSLHGASVPNVSFLLLNLQLKGYVVETESHAYLRAERE